MSDLELQGQAALCAEALAGWGIGGSGGGTHLGHALGLAAAGARVVLFGRRVPSGSIARAGQLTGPAALLLSPMASFVTKHNLVVGGGWTAW